MRRRRAEDGFTLVELLIVVTIVPIVVGAVVAAMFVAFSVQSGVTDRVGAAGGAEVSSALFYQDVQSALMVTTSSSASQCGAGTQILGLEWMQSTSNPSVYDTVVSYNEVATTDGTQLFRDVCTAGASPTAFNVTDLADNLIVASTLPTVTGATASSGWVSTATVSQVAFIIDESGNNSYTMVSSPVADESTVA